MSILIEWGEGQGSVKAVTDAPDQRLPEELYGMPTPGTL